MYKVLIAEDERIIRKGILFSVPWEELGLAVVAEAENGEDGARLIREKNPDIVITDINMPLMDGLEMIKSTKDEIAYSTIIISGYSDFKYAKDAIKYGVTAYLLKPYSEEELKDVILTAIKQCVDRDKLRSYTQKKEYTEHEFLPKHGDIDEEGITGKIMEYIHTHYHEKITMQVMEELVNYSERMINIKFKEEVGTTVIDYLNRYRIRKAVELLNEEESSMNQIAWECGFGDYKYFGVVFKKYVGVSPKEYLMRIK